MKALLIAGTDTGVGKTVLTAALAAYWQIYCPGRRLGLMKPIQCGVGDWERYRQLFGAGAGIEIAPPLSLKAPLAPPIAAEREGQTIDLERLWQALSSLEQRQEFVLAEALGGLGSPVTREWTVADLAGAWSLPTVLAVAVRLGGIGQAVANVALAREKKVKLQGIVLNCCQPDSGDRLADWTPPDLIQSLTCVPVVGTLPYLPDLDGVEPLAQAASRLAIEQLLPVLSSPMR